MDSLFCLDDPAHGNDDDESFRLHAKLCREICTEKRDDAKAWSAVLRYTLDKLARGGDDAANRGKRILVLHRRAVGRFKCFTNNISSSSAGSSYSNNGDPPRDDLLQIWLFYAITQLVYDSVKNSADTYRHVQRVFHPEEGKEFWRALLFHSSDAAANAVVDSTLDVDVIVEILKLKLGKGEKTMVDCVDEQWSGLKSRGLLHRGSSGDAKANKIALPSLNQRAGLATATAVVRDEAKVQAARQSAQNAHEVAQSKRVVLQSNSTCKRLSSDDNDTQSSVQEKANCYRAKRMEARKKARTDRLTARSSSNTTKLKKKEVSIAAILSQTMEDDGTSSEDGEEMNPSMLNTSITNNHNFKLKSTANATPETNNDWLPLPSDHCNDNSNNNNALLPSSAPDSDQAKKHFKENISPIEEGTTASIKDMDLGYLLNWDPNKSNHREATKNKKKQVTIAQEVVLLKEEKRRAPPKITRNDLGYMMNWEPFPKSREENGGSDVSIKKDGERIERKRGQSSGSGGMSRIEEETEASLAVSSEGGDSAKGPSCSLKNDGDTADAEEQKLSSTDTIATHPKNNSKCYSQSEKSADADTTLPDVEQSFLPLIETNNIIKVDNEPYAKLGVIGKGGSCKVYRALSRECDVVALKKVKLDGLSKQAIDGYANEIALLNRLKGNPAIIQLYSSEVDLERKSIYLVMELGEVDLNYVLRQQELLSSKQGRGGRSSLNMNFIRLTWQQMLSAVHSIHEERIVHSDLKPAVSITLVFCRYYHNMYFCKRSSHTRPLPCVCALHQSELFICERCIETN